MPTTIREVAQHAGVSIATVSRVLNNVGPVDERTRERVRESVRQLRYVPNAVGRSLSRRKTEAIGLLLPDLFGEFFSEVLRGSDQTAQHSNYHLRRFQLAQQQKGNPCSPDNDAGAGGRTRGHVSSH